MATRRRERNSLVDPRKVGLTLEGDADDKLKDLADRLGITKSELAQWLIEHVAVDRRGVPDGWSHPLPEDEELPIISAA